MGATHTPYEDKIGWNGGNHINGGVSNFGRYVTTRREDGTFDVVFISGDRVEPIGDERQRERGLTESEAYWLPVEHNKKLLGITGGGSKTGAIRRKRRDAPLCPECQTEHNGECAW